MGKDVLSWVNAITAAISFALTVMIIIVIDFRYGIPFISAFGLGLLIYGLILFGVFLSRYTRFFSQIFYPARRWLQFKLSAIVIEIWKAKVDIDEQGNAEVCHDFKGKINLENNSWFSLGILTDEEQEVSEKFEIEVINMTTGKAVKPDYIVNCPKYKRLKIKFDRQLTRGDTFHYRIKYMLNKTFFLNTEDFYTQTASHFEKRIEISINFPRNVFVSGVFPEIITPQGDNWKRFDKPKFDDYWIHWVIKRAVMSNEYKLRWTTQQK